MAAVVRNRDGAEMHTVDEWGRLAKPASENHWKDGRSAKELAKSWVAGEGQVALERLFETHEETCRLVIETAVADQQIAFDLCMDTDVEREARGSPVVAARHELAQDLDTVVLGN